MATFDIISIAKRDDGSIDELLHWLVDNVGQLVTKGRSPFVTIFQTSERHTRHVTGIGWHLVLDVVKKPTKALDIKLTIYDDVLATQAKLIFI